jgi:hypothetical protein
LRQHVLAYIEWLNSARGRLATPMEAQRHFAVVRLKFNLTLTQFDLFADALTQRSEHETGVWLGGLDVAAADALALPGNFYQPPPVVCYLDRGVGAAIRRARTRLPGGGRNPVAIVRVPRERMVGSGIASSLVHEVGHQAAALLDLVRSFSPVLRGLQRTHAAERTAWLLWERWISEIVADFWSVARVGVGSTLGLMGVVSLPRSFMFRLSPDDPHPIPWVRVRLSCAMGQALFPHPQWEKLAATWEDFYPLAGLTRSVRNVLAALFETMQGLVALLVNHRPRLLHGLSLQEVLATSERQPAQLSAMFREWRTQLGAARTTPPTLAFAVLGQARMDGQLTPQRESALVAELLKSWALRSTLDVSAMCAERALARSAATV